MKELKVFIAGSKALDKERAMIRSALQILSNTNSKHILIRTYTYEEFGTSFTREGRQTEYDRFIKEDADYVIFIIDGKIGGITRNEFDIAWNAFMKNGKKPSIYVYHKQDSSSPAEIQDVVNKINQCNQYYTDYRDLESLRAEVTNAFYRVIDQYGFYKKLFILLFVGLFFILTALGGVWFYSRTAVTAPSIPQAEQYLDSLNRAQKIELLRQDSMTRAIKAETNRLARERARLEEQTKNAEQRHNANVSNSEVSTSSTASTESSVSVPMSVSAPSIAETPKQTSAKTMNIFAETKAKADAGDAISCYKVAQAYMNGNGTVEKNSSSAFYYMKAAADKGYVPAYIEVAKMYHGGRGVAKNRTIAEQWYKKAAEAGNAEARRILLNM